MKITQVSHRYIFNRKKKLNSEGRGLLQSEIRIGKERKFYSTGLLLSPKQWNKDSSQIINHPNAYNLNRKLFKLRAVLSELNSFDEIEAHFKGAKPESFLDYYSAYIENHNGAYSTYKQYRSTFNHLKSFGGIKLFTDLTPENIQNFSDYLSSAGLSHQTVYNVHKRVKTAVRRAFVAGKIDRNPYDMMRFPVPKSGEIRYFNESSLKKLENWQPDSPKLDKIKDVFLQVKT